MWFLLGRKRILKKQTAKRTRSGTKFSALGLIILAAVILIYYFTGGTFPQNSSLASASQPATVAPNGQALQVYYLDVGQADCQLLFLPSGEIVMIDAGDRGTRQELADYLREQNIQKIDYLIATHPHADHIGGMADVVENFEIGKIIAPRIADSQIPTTQTYEDLLSAVSAKGLKLSPATAGTVLIEQESLKLELLAPVLDEYSDLNNYSVVTKLTYGDTSFLFTGDAEAEAEEAILQAGYDPSATVLKCGHHGSSTSTSDAFLKAVSPSFAVISCGQDNDYGHPHAETLEKLQNRQVTVYRTDQQGTILAQSDGSSITFQDHLPSVA